jgi:hypothetical protein
MSTADAAFDEQLFREAPPFLPGRSGGGIAELRTAPKALLVVVVGWVPVVLLTFAQALAAGMDIFWSLLFDVAVHARYLGAAPLLVLAEAVCAPRLGEIVHHFLDRGIVEARHRPQFREAVDSTRRLLRAPAAAVVIFCGAALIVLAAAVARQSDVPLWAQQTGVVPQFSPAGWWVILVSVPLLVVLILGWAWRVVLWTRLLWRISRLEPRVVVSHPDHCGGLAFLGHSVGAFAIVALAIAVVLAARSAEFVLSGGGVPTPYLIVNAAVLVVLAVTFVVPLIVFVPAIATAQLRETLRYDDLAAEVGRAFEERWLGSPSSRADALQRPDFSATADLYQIVANVHAMRPLPVDLKDLAALVVAMLLPFLPVLLLVVPASVIWKGVTGMLL